MAAAFLTDDGVEFRVSIMQLPASPDLNDIQGLLISGFGKLPCACYLHLRIADPAAAGRWLAGAPITTAADCQPAPARALQVAITSRGMSALGAAPAICNRFSIEFLSGMAVEGDRDGRSRRLGDVRANSPEKWEWGYAAEDFPHVMLLLFAREPTDAWRDELVRELAANGFVFQRCLDTSDLDDREPFGFRDGMSQPELDWKRERRVSERNELEYTNQISLGEFVLGYPNEYGQFTDCPLIDDATADLPQTEDPEHRGKMDLGKNGTYLVLRRLEQDVRGFWRFLDEQAQGDAARRVHLAEMMVGRRMDGRPLIGDHGADFTYESDPEGQTCPFGAHIRRANPRTADLPYGTRGLLLRIIRFFGFGRTGVRGDLIASSRFHRILRRGREFGRELKPDEALLPAPPDDGKRGLNFICLNANIARQFEFVQNAWMATTKFDGLTEESDPLLGNREEVAGSRFTDAFTVREQGPVRTCLRGLPQFVTVRGGAYFFMPGLKALRYLAKCAQNPTAGHTHD